MYMYVLLNRRQHRVDRKDWRSTKQQDRKGSRLEGNPARRQPFTWKTLNDDNVATALQEYERVDSAALCYTQYTIIVQR